MTVSDLGTRRIAIPDGTAYELASFSTSQVEDGDGLHHVTTLAFDRENQFLFEVVAPPCTTGAIATTCAQAEQHAEDRLRSHAWAPGDSDHLRPANT